MTIKSELRSNHNLILKEIQMTKPKTNYRDAETGQYIPKEQAEKHPKTSVKETDKSSNNKPAPKKKK